MRGQRGSIVLAQACGDEACTDPESFPCGTMSTLYVRPFGKSLSPVGMQRGVVCQVTLVCIHDVRQTTLHIEARCRLGLTEYSFHDPLAAPDVGIRAAVTGRVHGLANEVARDYDLGPDARAQFTSDTIGDTRTE